MRLRCLSTRAVKIPKLFRGTRHLLSKEEIVMMRRLFAHMAFACLALLIAATAAFAQGNDTRYSLTCNDQDNYGNSRARHCEVKEQTVTAGALDVDGAQNGGIAVKGWDRNETL